MDAVFLEVENLAKKFGSFTAVNGVSFEVPKGRIIGLLGPNGAGKTTTIHMLLGVTLASGGRIRYFAKDFYKNKGYCLSRINFASSFNTLQGRISVRENLEVFAQLYLVKDADKKIKELMEYFEIINLQDQKFWDLSAGQKTRVNLAKSLINDPQLILMDEPTASLDPDIADKTLTLIERLNKERGLSILYTSHDMNEVTRICDEVIFLDQGRIVAQDTPINLTRQIKDAQLILSIESGKSNLETLLTDNELVFRNSGAAVHVNLEEKDIPRVLAQIHENRISLIDIEIKRPTLEDVFLQIARRKNVS